jgi:hypothetical protein
MKYYIIKKDEEMHLTPVRPESETIFRILNESQIIVSGDNMQEALRKYDELPFIIDDPL